MQKNFLNQTNYYLAPHKWEFAHYIASAFYLRPDYKDRGAEEKEYWEEAGTEIGEEMWNIFTLNGQYGPYSLTITFSSQMEFTLIIELHPNISPTLIDDMIMKYKEINDSNNQIFKAGVNSPLIIISEQF